MISMDKMKVGDFAEVKEIKTKGTMRRRFLDLGLIENTEIECVGISAGGDPSAYLIRGAVIAVRHEDASEIYVELINEK